MDVSWNSAAAGQFECCAFGDQHPKGCAVGDQHPTGCAVGDQHPKGCAVGDQHPTRYSFSVMNLRSPTDSILHHIAVLVSGI